LTGKEFPNWQAHRIQSVTQAGWPPLIQSIWKPLSGGTETLLRLDVYQCNSPDAAQDFLLRLLGHFQSPQIARHKDSIVGDVALAPAGETALVFARANLVVFIANAGSKLVPVRDVARRLDEELTSEPATTVNKTLPSLSLSWGVVTPFQAGTAVPLQLHAADPLEKPLWYKIHTRLGELVLESGHPIYRPISPGQDQLTVFAFSADHRVVRQEWSLDVR
jgi:hypothetical protein